MSERKDNTNDFDLMMKSVLDEGREDVPAHIWEGVSAGLDKAARRKTVVLWWRRAAIGVAAAAAVFAGVIFNQENDDILVPAVSEGDMIAVVTPADDAYLENVSDVEAYMLAQAVPADKTEDVAEIIVEQISEQSSEQVSEQTENAVTVNDSKTRAPKTADEALVQTYYPEDWGEETVSRSGRKVSLVLSGIAGTNNTEGQRRLNPMKKPSLNPVPQKTGIEETSTKASYGIPVSFGLGVKVGLSPRWSVGAGLDYTLLSRQFYGKYTRVGANGSIENYTSSDIRNTQHYVGIPVNAFYDMISNDRISLYAYAGGSVEKCVSDRYSLLNTSIVHKEKVDGVQLSANAGIGVEFMLGRHLGLYIDPSIRYYFNNGQPKSIRTVQPLMLGFEMGFRARL